MSAALRPDHERLRVIRPAKRLAMRGTRLSLMLCPIVVSACNLFGPEVDCGPLPGVACDQQVQEIQTIVARDFPARRVVSIEFVNEEGDATVRLDDGTEVGWGGSERR